MTLVTKHPVINLVKGEQKCVLFSESVNVVSREKCPGDLDYVSKSVKCEYKIRNKKHDMKSHGATQETSACRRTDAVKSLISKFTKSQ